MRRRKCSCVATAVEQDGQYDGDARYRWLAWLRCGYHRGGFNERILGMRKDFVTLMAECAVMLVIALLLMTVVCRP
jgi:hypothetical protein